jgi:hypothetical protein
MLYPGAAGHIGGTPYAVLYRVRGQQVIISYHLARSTEERDVMGLIRIVLGREMPEHHLSATFTIIHVER